MPASPGSIPAHSINLELASEAETAEALGISTRTLKRWREARQGPRHTMIGRNVYYRHATLRAWVEAQERAA